MNCTLLYHVEGSGYYVPAGVPARVLGWRVDENGVGRVRCLVGVALRTSDGVVARGVELEVYPVQLKFESISPESW